MRFELLSEWGSVVVILVPTIIVVVGGLMLVANWIGNRNKPA